MTGDKGIPELHLRQPKFTYSAVGPFIKHLERIQKLRETDDLKQLYRNELDKACSAHDDAHPYGKYLAKITKIWKDRAFETARKQD